MLGMRLLGAHLSGQTRFEVLVAWNTLCHASSKGLTKETLCRRLGDTRVLFTNYELELKKVIKQSILN